jgi:hypothetical protein
MPQTALTPAQRLWIGKMANVSNNLLQNILPLLIEGNNLFNSGSPNGYLFNITQASLDADPTLSGLTTTQLANGIGPLTNAILNDIQGNDAVLAQLAAAGGN